MSTLGHDTEDRDRLFRAAVDGRYTASHQTAEESQWQPKKREPPGRDDPEAVEYAHVAIVVRETRQSARRESHQSFDTIDSKQKQMQPCA